MSILDKFSSENPYVIAPLLLTAGSNQADLQVITRESDQLNSTSVFLRSQGLTNTLVNPISSVTAVAQQTLGELENTLPPRGPINCPEISQWTLKERNGCAVAVKVETLTLNDFLWNPVTQTFEEIIKCDPVESELWEVLAFNKAKVTGSPTTPLIEGTWDIKGTPFNKVKLNMHALSIIGLINEYTNVKSVVKKRQRGTVMHISTIGPSHIYCAGQMADKMLGIHNLKPNNES